MSDCFAFFLKHFLNKLRNIAYYVSPATFKERFRRLPIPEVGILLEICENLATRKRFLTYGKAIEFTAERRCRNH
jgi:hypothetical protein